MIRADFYGERSSLELLYIPFFQSAIFDLTGSDLSLIQSRGKSWKLPSQFERILTRTVINYPAQKVDFQEQKFVTGEAGAKYAVRSGKSQLELIYFSTREDFPFILYTQPANLTQNSDPNDVGALTFDFDRYLLYGLTYMTDLGGVHIAMEAAASPQRTLVEGLDSNNDGYVDQSRRAHSPWQAVSIELDYLAPSHNYFIKVGAERSQYFDPPPNLMFASGDSLLFLVYIKLFALDNALSPEFRAINIQTSSNQWYFSPRLAYSFQNRYSATMGLNIYTGSGGTPGPAGQDFSPLSILSDNNQVFFSFRTSF